MGSSNFISAAVLDISWKATAVKERADFIGRLRTSWGASGGLVNAVATAAVVAT